MSDYYAGEIRIFAGNYAPQDWHICDGTLLKVNDYQVLYSLLSTTYGGDGINTFGLPDFRGRVPVGMGTGPGLTARALGQSGGAETVTLQASQYPAHSHTISVMDVAATTTAPSGNLLAQPSNGYWNYLGSATTGTAATLATTAIGMSGGASNVQGHDNMMPTMALNFIIALIGVYPQRA